MVITEYIRNVDHAILNTVFENTVFGVSIHIWRLVGDTLNITCFFLYCNHQVNRKFLITLYYSYTWYGMTVRTRYYPVRRCRILSTGYTSRATSELQLFGWHRSRQMFLHILHTEYKNLRTCAWKGYYIAVISQHCNFMVISFMHFRFI
jgi:hypothetical protein